MTSGLFSQLQGELDNVGVYTHIKRHGKVYILYKNYNVHSTAKTRITLKRRVIDMVNEYLSLKLNRYQ